MARELAEGKSVVTDTRFDGHLPGLPPVPQIDDLRPAVRDDLLRDSVGNGTHGALSVVSARGVHPPAPEHGGRVPRMATMRRFMVAREIGRQVALAGVPVALIRCVLNIAPPRDWAADCARQDTPSAAATSALSCRERHSRPLPVRPRPGYADRSRIHSRAPSKWNRSSGISPSTDR